MSLNTFLSKRNEYFNLIEIFFWKYRTGVDQPFMVSPAMPVYYKFEFPPNIDNVFLEVDSNDDLCAVVSVQSYDCPVYDVGEIGVRQGHYQTMSKSASFNVYVIYNI